MTNETEIDGYTVYTTKHPPLRGLQLKARILKIVAPAAEALMSAGFKSLEEVSELEFNQANAKRLLPVVRALLAGVSPEDVPALVAEILSGTSIIPPDKSAKFDLSKPSKIDQAFADRESLMYQVIAHAAGVNLPDFFALAGSVMSATPAPSLST